MDACLSEEGSIQLLHAPLGLLRVIAGLRRLLADVDVYLFTRASYGQGDPARALDAFLRAWQPAVVGISSFSRHMPTAIRIAETVRAWDDRVPIVLGGSHATARPGGIALLAAFDWFVVGDGDVVGPRLIGALLGDGTDPRTLPSVSFRQNAVLVQTPRVEHSGSLDEVPPIDWEEADLARYRSSSQSTFLPVDLELGDGPLVPYLASRGCSYHCAFCERSDGTRVRTHSPERVVADIRALRVAFRTRNLIFLDNHIHLDRAWFASLVEALRTHHSDMTFACGVMADKLDRQTLDAMWEAGFRMLWCFPESGSEEVLGRMRKPIRLERLVENMAYASELGMLVYGNFLLGWPGETASDVEKSLALAREPFFDLVGFCGLVYLPGAEVYDHIARLGIEPDTPEFFAMLENPPVLTEYGAAAYQSFTDQGNVMNLWKIRQPSTRAKLRRLGLTVHFNGFEGRRADDLAHSDAQPSVASPAGSIPDDRRQPTAAPIATEETGALQEILGSGCELEILDAKWSRQQVTFLIHDRTEGSAVRLFLARRGSGPHLVQTARFDVGFVGDDLTRPQAALFKRFVSALRNWDALFESAPGHPGISPALASLLGGGSED